MTAKVSDDLYAVVCNYLQSTGVASDGAKAYVIGSLGGNLPERVEVLVRSRGGRWVDKWENTKRLGSCRIKTLPPEHPMYSRAGVPRDVAESRLDRLIRALGIEQP